jgi:hypothetical protein
MKMAKIMKKISNNGTAWHRPGVCGVICGEMKRVGRSNQTAIISKIISERENMA